MDVMKDRTDVSSEIKHSLEHLFEQIEGPGIEANDKMRYKAQEEALEAFEDTLETL